MTPNPDLDDLRLAVIEALIADRRSPAAIECAFDRLIGAARVALSRGGHSLAKLREDACLTFEARKQRAELPTLPEEPTDLSPELAGSVAVMEARAICAAEGKKGRAA